MIKTILAIFHKEKSKMTRFRRNKIRVFKKRTGFRQMYIQRYFDQNLLQGVQNEN